MVEIWTTTNGKGVVRYWRYSTLAGRAVPVPKAQAELGLMTGTHELTEKPPFVGR